MSTDAIAAGLISGIISPFIVSWLQHRVIWKRQKQLELKHRIFEEVVRAFGLWARDAMDPRLQSEKASFKETSRVTELRPETVEMLERSKGMVQAFFAPETFSAFEHALRAKISIENIPNEDFEQRRTTTIVTMAAELGITQSRWKDHLMRFWRKARWNKR